MKGKSKTSTKIIRQYGYEYYLVEVHRGQCMGIPDPCFMGYEGMALSKVIKINKERLR